MNIPKYVEKLIERRAKLASDLNHVDYELYKWLEKNGLNNKVEEYDVLGGCEIYVNPYASASRIREAVLNN